MSRPYDLVPGGKKEIPKYLCPWRILANPNLVVGNTRTPITIHDDPSTRAIYRTLNEQNEHCKLWCKAKSCRLTCRESVVDTFSPKSEKPEPFRLRGERSEKGVIEANGIIIDDDEEKNKVIAD